MMRLLILCLAITAGLTGQTGQLSDSIAKQLESAAKQRAAIEPVGAKQATDSTSAFKQQRESVRRQHLSGQVAEGGFFTIPWPDPPAVSSGEISLLGGCGSLNGSELAALTKSAAEKAGVGEELLSAVIRQESGNRPCAVSQKGALGLMQLMPGTANWLGVRNPLDPEENVAAGSSFLRSLIDRYSGDLSLALAAYNSGPARVDRAGGVPEIPETRDYVKSVMEQLKRTAARPPDIPRSQ